MSNNLLGLYSEGDAREIHKRVLGHSLRSSELGQAKQYTVQNMLYYAVLTENLSAATDPEIGYTSAECRVLRYVQPISATSLDMELATGDISLQTITNRYTTFSASIGDVLLIIRNGAEWSPVNAVGSSSQKHATVVSCLGNGYYSAYLSLSPTFDLPSITGTGTDTGTGSGQYDECDPCQWITGENTGTDAAACGSLNQPSRVSVPGDGALIYCYDPRKLVLGIGAHIIVTNMGDTVANPVAGTGTGTGTAIDTIPLYMILTGNYDLVGIPDRFYTCCNDTVIMTRCDTYIVEGVYCPGIEIECTGTGTGTA
jgi:hypothetical protein